MLDFSDQYLAISQADSIVNNQHYFVMDVDFN